MNEFRLRRTVWEAADQMQPNTKYMFHFSIILKNILMHGVFLIAMCLVSNSTDSDSDPTQRV